LEAYFYNDPRIEEWINQITEKILTVCLLTGIDSEAEFQKGCQIVTDVMHLLQEISSIPAEYLEDGLKQLLEQQLPDSRIISNFPSFQDTLNKMLHEGMTRTINTQNKEILRTLPFSKKNTFETEEVGDTAGSLINDRLVADEVEVISALASVDSTCITNTSQLSGILHKMIVPEQAACLKFVLGNLFPNASVSWNLSLMGHTFIAQVEDILIYLNNSEHPCNVEKFNKEGWKVYMCNSEDLLFLHRLERGIRQIRRLSRQRKNGNI
jgi:hypothetical protein